MRTRQALVGALLVAACADQPTDTTHVTSFDPPTTTTTTGTTEPIGTVTTEVPTTGGATSGTTDGVGDFFADHDLPGGQLPCGGRLDLLFVLSRGPSMEDQVEVVEAAVPEFLALIEERFEGWDLHIMFVASDIDGWGIEECDGQCEANDGQGCAPVGPADYPCSAPLEPCDDVFGAGVTFPAGIGSSNMRCDTGDRRYISPLEDELASAFPCVAGQGLSVSGTPIPASAMQVALSDDLRSGCNAGFLRDDALLLVALITDDTSNAGKGSPEEWTDALLHAKNDNPDAWVILGITSDDGQPGALCGSPGDGSFKLPIQEFMSTVPHGIWGSICAPDIAPFFEEAIDHVDEVCEIFAPT